jgi:hypothetical protein
MTYQPLSLAAQYARNFGVAWAACVTAGHAALATDATASGDGAT